MARKWFLILDGMHHICFHVRKWKNPGERKQGQTTLFSMQLLLHIHCSVGVFKAAHVPTDTGWWARILAASSWRLKRKRHPVSEGLCMCTDKVMTPLRWCLGLGQGLACLLSLSPPPCPVTSLHMAVSYCQAPFWKPHQWSAFFDYVFPSGRHYSDVFVSVPN